MARRNKRASMREGPLADLFRSTSKDQPQDPPEEPRFGRDDPAERTDATDQDSGEGGAQTGRPRTRERASEIASGNERERAGAEEAAADSVRPSGSGGGAGDDAGAEEAAVDVGSRSSDRLKRIFGEDPQESHPRYGREDPSYEPKGGEPHTPKITVVGVGGAGVNAVNRMVEARVPGVEFMAVNTDLQSLQLCVADVTVHIGEEQTRGLGAGADPELGHRSAFDEQDKIKRLLKGSDMVFVAAGAGGGTGTGAAPVIARLAREVGALTVGIATRPFSFEGTRRGNAARKGIDELAAEVDTLIVVPNDRLLEVLDQQTSMVEAFQVADDVLRQGVQGISDLVTLPAVINLDFADVRSIMSEAGQALLGIGMATGEDRAVMAAEKATSSPLLETSMEGARSILLSVTGGSDLSLIEVSEAAKAVGEAAHPDANIIFGANIDDELSDQIWVTVVATRFDGRSAPPRRAAEPTIRRTADGGRSGSRRRDDLGIDVPEFLPG